MIFRKKQALEHNRPVLRIEMGPADWILEILAIASLLSFIGFMVYQYATLPETVPTHFNASGKPDEYGEKTSLWLLPVIAVVVYSIMSLIGRIPEKHNYPVKITPANARRQYTMGTRLLRILKLAIILMFFYIGYQTVMISLQQTTDLGLFFIPVFLGMISLPVIVYFILASRNR